MMASSRLQHFLFNAIILVAIVTGSRLISWFFHSPPNKSVAPESNTHQPLKGFNDPKTAQLRANVVNDNVQADDITAGTDSANETKKSSMMLPNILLIGAQKAGSTSISDYIFSNGVCRPNDALDEKETHFFDNLKNYNRQNAQNFANHFQHCKGHDFIMDATPKTMLFPDRVHSFYKNIGYDLSRLKLIVILREPISRELSLYNYKRALYSGGVRKPWIMDIFTDDGTFIPFDDYAMTILKGELTKHPEMARGFYVDHLKKWISFFKRDQLLVLSFDELKNDPTSTLWRIQKFLGTKFPDMTMPHTNNHPHSTVEVSQRANQALEQIFQTKNEQLYQFLDKHPGPSMEQRPFPRFR
mmetsp:Transcript_29440/g.62502  ORF Transcript_29440/g.62502 Transcript_29440/m.62502 type:complete len:357 (-) Transcript_29440:77-1147(-)